MEKRRLGNTDMDVSVLGFGGSEIGYEGSSVASVREMLHGALYRGLNVIDTAECYVTSEELIGKALGGHERGWSYPDWRPASLWKSLERSLKRLKTDPVDLLQLHSCSEAELRNGHVIEFLKSARERGYTRYIGYSGDGDAALYAVESGVFDTLQTSINIADQETLDLTLPAARNRNIGVIAKRPLANVAWAQGDRPPHNGYGYPYWKRLRKLDYEFLAAGLEQSVATALRFVVTVPGVHTAIVGTTKPGRFAENARAVESGTLPAALFERIRNRWRDVASSDWVGQT